MYIRFVVGTNRDCPTTQAGVVTELRMLRDSGRLPDYEVEHVEEIFEHINEVLPCPPFEASDWSPEAISWFKDSAQDMIRTFREIIALLQEYGRPVRTLVTDMPGTILYEDEFQVVAESEYY
jgi:hypothetical protein